MDNGQKLDWTQLSIFLSPVDEHDFEYQIAASGFPGMSGVSKDGTFEMKNVPGGHYQLLVGSRTNDMRDYFTKAVNLDGRDVADSGFAISPGMSLDVVLSANGATIQGTVADSQGKPVPYAAVVGVPSAEHRARPDLYEQDTTDEHGHFSLRGLNPGKYTVFAFEELPELQRGLRDPGFLTSYEGRGEEVELDEGARRSIALKVIPADAD
jgi:hypothetical protein